MTNKIVLASNNKGKIREFNALLENLHLQFLPQGELHVNEIEETGLTFIENAILKARHAAKVTGLPALADDSGLVVKALNGAPGIYSARYAGTQGDASKNIQKLLADMKALDNREAYFYCVLAFLLHEKDPTPLICTGLWKGTILNEAKGTNGFGYDPVFFVQEQGVTAAELPPEVKNQISHRAHALSALQKLLPEKLKS